jgi:hypothetical protein
MAVYSGPYIKNDGMVFYIDAKNIKSTSTPGKMGDVISGRKNDFIGQIQNGYFYSNYGIVEKFSNNTISESDAITINILISHDERKFGTAIAIGNDTILNSTPTSISFEYVYAESNTTAIGEFNFAETLAATPRVEYVYTETSTSATNLSSLSVVYDVTPTASYVYAETSVIATASIAYDIDWISVGNMTYVYTQSITYATGIHSNYGYTYNDITIFADQSQMIASHSNSGISNQVVVSANPGDRNQYSVIFRKLANDTIPISVYRNGVHISDAGTISGSSVFANGISVFGKLGSEFSQYGIRNISVYNRELDASEIFLINRVELNR